jgi:hypothetical protein
VSTLAEALAYAARGWPVFPIRPGTKEPYGGTHGHLDATTGGDQIRAWWQRWPSAEVGIATGASGLFVLDVDPDKGGDGSLAALLASWGPLPATLTASTPRGGRHLYFAGSGPSTQRRIGPGLDTRGQGGYVVAPPAPGRHWTIDIPPAPVPPWLLEALTESNDEGPKFADGDLLDIEELFRGVPEGKRDETFWKYACSLRGRNLRFAEAESLIRTAWQKVENGTHPFPLAKALDQLRRAYEEYEPNDVNFDANFTVGDEGKAKPTDKEKLRNSNEYKKELARQSIHQLVLTDLREAQDEELYAKTQLPEAATLKERLNRGHEDEFFIA